MTIISLQYSVYIALLCLICISCYPHSISATLSEPAISADLFSCQYKTRHGTFDLSQYTTTIKGPGLIDDGTTYLNLCKNVDECGGSDTSICATSVAVPTAQQLGSMSSYPVPTAEYSPSTKTLNITYHNTQAQCFRANALVTRTTHVLLSCGSSLPSTFKIVTAGSDPCEFNIILAHPIACVDVGLSWGGIILITIGIIILCYFIIGVVISKFLLKKQGLDIIPHRTFWSLLPGLFLAGVSFFIISIKSKCQRKTSANDSSASDYGSVEEGL